MLTCILSATQTQNETQGLKEENIAHQAARLKAIHMETAPYPEEARKKGVEGKVTLNIAVDAKGYVSQATILSGPPELFQAALDSTKLWQFEPPTTAPVVKTVEVSFGFPKECQGSESDHGEVTASTRLQNKAGTIFDMEFENDRLPPYPEEARKAGIAGEMILSLTLTAEGRVTLVSVIKSLSPQIDKTAVETVRTWKFKPKTGNLNNMPGDFSFHIFFRPTCDPRF
jgi:TonB family protein